MEIQSKLEEKTIKTTLLTIRINPKEKERLVEVLNSLLKKSKPDRLEEYVISSLIQAIENPEIDEPYTEKNEKPIVETIKKEKVNVLIEASEEKEKIDKVAIVNGIKNRTDPQNKENLDNWIKGSIKFAQTQMGIKTMPKSETTEDFYDWLVANSIIDIYGNPLLKK